MQAACREARAAGPNVPSIPNGEYRDGAAPGGHPAELSFYLRHQGKAAAYIRDLEEKWEELESSAQPANAELQHRLDEARKRLLARQA